MGFSMPRFAEGTRALLLQTLAGPPRDDVIIGGSDRYVELDGLGRQDVAYFDRWRRVPELLEGKRVTRAAALQDK